MAVLTGLFTLGRDAESRVSAGGKTVVQLAVAYNYGRKGDDNRRPSQWLRLAMFGNQAQALAPHLTKGKQVSLIVRDLHIATFQKQDGTTGTALEGVADFDDFASGAKMESAPAPTPAASRGNSYENARQGRAPAPAPRPSSGFDDMDDPIPF